jgi:hypothetical protein
MVVIMALSSEWFSSRHTGGVVVGLLAWVAPWLAPADVVGLHGAARKTAHFVEYAILALLWFRALARDTAPDTDEQGGVLARVRRFLVRWVR